MRLSIIYIVLFLFTSLYSGELSKLELNSLGWLSGSWQNEQASTTTEECWVNSEPDDMLGMHRSINPNGKTFLEYLKIEKTAQGIVYIVYPAGQQKNVFKLVHATGNRAVFSNASQEYPQNIIYWLDNENILHAQMSGKHQGQLETKEWVFNKILP